MKRLSAMNFSIVSATLLLLLSAAGCNHKIGYGLV